MSLLLLHTAGIALTASVSAAAPNRKGHELLVGAKTRELATAAVKGIGQIVGVDSGSGMLEVEVGAGWTSTRAIEELLKRPGVQYALPFSAKSLDRSRLSSVSDYLRYLDAADVLADPKNRDNGDSGDFLEARKYYLKRHVAIGKDTIDFGAIKRAYRHKAQMPQENIGYKDPSAAQTSLTEGNWNFQGPKNLASPYNIYYGTPPLCGRISCIAYDPTTSSTIYAGSGGGGLWKSLDGGVTWNCISVDPINNQWTYQAVDCIAVDPLAPKTIYVGTGDFDGFYDGYNQGVMKSTDRGTTWTSLASNVTGIANLAISRIVVDPTNDNIITLTTGRGAYFGPGQGTGNVWQSTNGGVTWTSAGLPASDYCALDISPVTGQYYVLGAGTPGLMYTSTNQGQTWTKLQAPDTSTETQWSLACSKTIPRLVYVVATGSDSVYYLDDGTWNNISATLPGAANGENNWGQKNYDYCIGCAKAPGSPNGELVFCGLITMCYSENFGQTWVDYGNTYQSNSAAPALMHNDQHQFAVSPSDPTQILLGNDGGLFHLSFQWSKGVPNIAFNSLGANLGITQLYQIAPHPSDPTQILGGAQDNASPSALTGQGGLASWANLLAGDGGWAGWNLAQSSLLTTSDEGSVFLYNLAGTAQVGISNVATENYDFIAPTLFSVDGAQIYLGGQTLQSYNIASETDQFLEGNTYLTNGYLSYLATVPGDIDRIYSGGDDGILNYTANGGAGWARIDQANLPATMVGAIGVDPGNENDLVVGYTSTGIQHLWECKNVTATPPIWNSVSGTGSTALPDAPINAIVRGPFRPDINWYVATDVGIFVTNNGGQSWANTTGYKTTLPNVQVNDLKYANGFLYAGTFGRGVWSIQIAPQGLSKVVISPNQVVGGTAAVGTVFVATTTPSAQVFLSSNSPAVILPAGSVTVPQTSTSGTFAIKTVPTNTQVNATITATYDGYTRTASITVMPLALAQLLATPSVVLGGEQTSTGILVLNGAAAASGAVVALSSNTASLTVPATVTVPSGSTTASFTIQTHGVNAQTQGTVTATLNGSTQSAVVTVVPPTVQAVTLAPSSVVGGSISVGTVQLDGPTGVSPIVVSLSSSRTVAAAVPATVVIPAHSLSANFNVTTLAVSNDTPVTVTATYGGVSNSGSLTVTRPLLANLAVSPFTIISGQAATGTVTLATPAGPSGEVVGVSAGGSLAVTIPASVTVAAGSTSATFAIQSHGVSVNTKAIAKAVLGPSSITCTFAVLPALVSKVIISPPSLPGGKTATGTVYLYGPAGPAGDVVVLTSNNVKAATVPANVTVAAGANSATFTVATSAVTATTNVIVTAAFNNSSSTGTLTVIGDSIAGLVLNPSKVAGGTSSTGTVTLSAPAPAGGWIVKLSSAQTAYATVQASITIPAGSTTGTFPIKTTNPPASTTVVITATDPAASKQTATLTIT